MSAYNLGRAIGEAGAKVWEGTGRPLTGWEENMAITRADVWVRAFGGVYRLALNYPLIVDLENNIPFGRLLGGLPGEDGAAPHRDVPQSVYTKLVRLALVGGGMGIVRGEKVTVDPAAAVALVEQLEDQPLAETWRLARAILEATIMGRPATPEEVNAFSMPAEPPIVPAWAYTGGEA